MKKNLKEILLKLMDPEKEYTLSDLENLLTKKGVYFAYSDEVWIVKEKLLREGKIRVASNFNGREKVILSLK